MVDEHIGSRDISEHSPIWLVKDNIDWRPKPFKVNNEWFSFKYLIPFVEKEWKEMVVEGRSDRVLKEKFWILKESLKWWNKEVFGRIDLEVEDEVREVNKRDELIEEEFIRGRDTIVKDRKKLLVAFG